MHVEIDTNSSSVAPVSDVNIKVGVDVPYFTTEDGVQIYYKDIYWCVDTINGRTFSCQAVSEYETQGKNTFSTKDLADNFLKKILAEKYHWTDQLIEDFVNTYRR